MIRLEKIGMRTIKTALAVTITLIICAALKIENPFFAVIAAIIVMEPSVSESLNSAKSRMFGTVLGAIFAMAYSFIFPSHPILLGLGIITLIYISNLLKIQNSIKISTIIFVSILLNYEETGRVSYAIARTIDTFIGISVGTLINYYVRPPNSGKQISAFINQAQEDIESFIDQLKSQSAPPNYDQLIDDLVMIEEKHRIIKKEIKLNLYPQKEVEVFKKSFKALENAYNHLSILVMIGNNLSNPSIYSYHLNEVERINTFLLRQKTRVEKGG